MKYIFIFPLKVKSHLPESRSPLPSTHRDIQDIYKLSTKCCVSLPFSFFFYVFSCTEYSPRRATSMFLSQEGKVIESCNFTCNFQRITLPCTGDWVWKVNCLPMCAHLGRLITRNVELNCLPCAKRPHKICGKVLSHDLTDVTLPFPCERDGWHLEYHLFEFPCRAN